jgi:hypothetical protein
MTAPPGCPDDRRHHLAGMAGDLCQPRQPSPNHLVASALRCDAPSAALRPYLQIWITLPLSRKQDELHRWRAAERTKTRYTALRCNEVGGAVM